MASRSAWAPGAMPKSTGVTIASSAAKTAIRQSTARLKAGTSAGLYASKSFSAPATSSTPATPAAALIKRLSVASWRSKRRRDAPSASLTFSSRVRPAPRAMTIVAWLTHAMATIAAIAPNVASAIATLSPSLCTNRDSSSGKSVTRRVDPSAAVQARGSSSRNAVATAASRAVAWVGVTPGLSRT
jgi:hypothetical protein